MVKAVKRKLPAVSGKFPLSGTCWHCLTAPMPYTGVLDRLGRIETQSLVVWLPI